MTNTQIVAEKLTALRKKVGLSQEELADKLFVSRQAISKWERGETLPDTDNLISLAKFYNVSLDELIGNDVQENSSKNDDDKNFFAENTTEEQTKAIISKDDICISDDEDDNEEDGVRVNLHAESIKVSANEVVDEIEEDIYYSYNDYPADKKRTALRLLHTLPYPIITTIAFLLWGFLADGWRVAWTLYITIPVYYSIIDCFRAKRVSKFAFPIFIAFIYCFIGMQWGLWHPYWILFLTVPIFYPIANAIDKKDD